MLLSTEKTVVPFLNMSSKLLADMRMKRPAPENLYDFLHEKDELELTDNHFLKLGPTSPSMPIFLKVICKDGTLFTIILHYPKHAGHGEIIGYSTIGRDLKDAEIETIVSNVQKVGHVASIRDFVPHPIDFSVPNE